MVDKAEAVDRLQHACDTSGVTAQLGADWVQHILADGFKPTAANVRSDVHAWPELSAEAKRGLIGEIASLATAHSEADPVAIMLTTLTATGSLMGRARFVRVGDTNHHARLFCALVGETICIVAHITRRELGALLNKNDVFGGLVNRIAWGCVRRPKVVPCPKRIDDQDAARLAAELARVTAHSHEHPGELRMSNSATELWVHVYPELTMDRSGLFGAATARAEAQTLRLALTYALVDGSDRLEQHHLEAGLAMWRYADDSARYLFGGLDDIDLDPVAQKILSALAGGPKTQTAIVDLFSRNLPNRKLQTVLTDLQERGFIKATKRPTLGRPQTVWELAPSHEKNERNDLWN